MTGVAVGPPANLVGEKNNVPASASSAFYFLHPATTPASRHRTERISHSAHGSHQDPRLGPDVSRATRQSDRSSARGRPAGARPWSRRRRATDDLHTANNQETMPGTVVRAEGAAPTNDPAVDEAYDGLG